MAEYSIFHNYKYEQKPPHLKVVDTLITPSRLAFGRKVIHVDKEGIGTYKIVRRPKFVELARKVSSAALAILTFPIQFLGIIIKANSEMNLPEAKKDRSNIEVNFSKKAFINPKPKALNAHLYGDFSPAKFEGDKKTLDTHLKEELKKLETKGENENTLSIFTEYLEAKEKRIKPLTLYIPEDTSPTTKKVAQIACDYLCLLYNTKFEVKTFQSSLESVQKQARSLKLGSLKTGEAYDKDKVTKALMKIAKATKENPALVFFPSSFEENVPKSPMACQDEFGGMIPVRKLKDFESSGRISMAVFNVIDETSNILKHLNYPVPTQFDEEKAIVCFETGCDLRHYVQRISDFYQKFEERYGIKIDKDLPRTSPWIQKSALLTS